MKKNDPIKEWTEWNENMYNPGYYTGGRLPPHLTGKKNSFRMFVFFISCSVAVFVFVSLYVFSLCTYMIIESNGYTSSTKFVFKSFEELTNPLGVAMLLSLAALSVFLFYVAMKYYKSHKNFKVKNKRRNEKKYKRKKRK